MTNYTYTKKIIMDNKTPEGVNAHTTYSDVYTDWYSEQVLAGLADDTKQFKDIFAWVSDNVGEILVTDQAQADSYIAMAYALADKIGYPLSATVVDYTE